MLSKNNYFLAALPLSYILKQVVEVIITSISLPGDTQIKYLFKGFPFQEYYPICNATYSWCEHEFSLNDWFLNILLFLIIVMVILNIFRPDTNKRWFKMLFFFSLLLMSTLTLRFLYLLITTRLTF